MDEDLLAIAPFIGNHPANKINKANAFFPRLSPHPKTTAPQKSGGHSIFFQSVDNPATDGLKVHRTCSSTLILSCGKAPDATLPCNVRKTAHKFRQR
jgi:hypothetical protein